MGKRAIIVDIDGTLANCDHRLHHIQKEEKDWDSFYSELHKDKCIEPIRLIVDSVIRQDPSIKLIFITGRPKKYSVKTFDWLQVNGFSPLWSELWMRIDGDQRPDSVIKREILHQLKELDFEILFTIEDRASVVKMWREEGILCLQCAEGDF